MPLTVPMDEELRLALPDLTRAERQLASHILSNYPVAALGSITALAGATLALELICLFARTKEARTGQA